MFFRRTAFYITGIIATALFVLCCNARFMKFITSRMSETKIKALQWDRNIHGDLYGLCYLKDFKTDRIGSYTDSIHKLNNNNHSADLWIIGDSYLENLTRTGDSVFYNTDLKYFYYTLTGEKTILGSLNTKNKKILLIEKTERYFRTTFLQTNFAGLIDTDVPNRNLRHTGSKGRSLKHLLLDQRLIPGSISEDLEAVLYGHELFSPLKEKKAAFNFNLFHRSNPAVFVSDNKYNLYANESIDTMNDFSAFKNVSDSEINVIVSNLNFISDEYKRKGFDEVVFSIVPNPVSILEPSLYKYNDLISRIQKNGNLKVPMIDAYTQFKEHPDPRSLYYRSDSHWSPTGFNIWLDQMNLFLKSYISSLAKNTP